MTQLDRIEALLTQLVRDRDRTKRAARRRVASLAERRGAEVQHLPDDLTMRLARDYLERRRKRTG